MHASSDHFSDCKNRHMILQEDILTGANQNQIIKGNIRFHVLKIVSPTEYIIRPTMRKSEDEKWIDVNSSNKFIYLDANMQTFYKNKENEKLLPALKLGEKCAIQDMHGKFYRGEILRVYET